MSEQAAQQFTTVAGGRGEIVQRCYETWRATGDKKAYHKMMGEVVGLCAQITRIRALKVPAELHETMLEAALEGAARGLKSYDPAKKRRLTTYLVQPINWAITHVIQDAFREQKKMPTLSFDTTVVYASASLAPRFMDLAEDKAQDTLIATYPSADSTPEERATRRETREAMLEAFSRLSEREAKVMRLRYFKDMEFDKISAAIGMTRSRAQQIHEDVIRKLRADPKLMHS
jgi:RNA polymerase sigma factor (sigma-70 family)